MVSGEADTVFRLKGPGRTGHVVLAAQADRPRMLVGGNPMDSQDQAILFSDGWIAVARVSPYRVDWRRPDGQWLSGPPLPLDTISVDRREKCAATERYLRLDCRRVTLPGWPEMVPPFLIPNRVPSRIPTLFAAANGVLVIARTPTATSSDNIYDIVGRNGRLVARLTLPGQYQVVGFGPTDVYLVMKDEMDLQHILRYDWPL